MTRATGLKILVIEDNPGDFLLIEDYLSEQLLNPIITNATSYKEAAFALTVPGTFDVVLLDLSLPDKQGEALITDILNISTGTPVIVLTGYENISFSIRSVSLGVADYLVKDNINANTLYKSIIYTLERGKAKHALVDSERKYSDLFHLSPQPMWIYDISSLKFLDVNEQAIVHYGYSRQEFLSMTIRDIRPAEDIPILDAVMAEIREKKTQSRSTYRHKKKNGDVIYVDLKAKDILFNGITSKIIVVNDITEITRYIKTIQEQNEKFREIAWIQSHVIRAPLARIMSLIDLMKNPAVDMQEKGILFGHMTDCANDLDVIIRDISDKTYQANAKVETIAMRTISRN